VEAALAWVPYEKKHEVDACEKGMDGLESHFAVGLPESRFKTEDFPAPICRPADAGPQTAAGNSRERSQFSPLLVVVL